MNKKALLNSVVALFFLYVLEKTDRERRTYKKKYFYSVSDQDYFGKPLFERGYKKGYLEGYKAAIEDVDKSLDSLSVHNHGTDNTTRYS